MFVLLQYFPEVKSLALPVAKDRGSYGKFTMKSKLGLLSKEGRAMLSTKLTTYNGGQLPTFEDLRQRSGLVLYEINITSKLKVQKDLKDAVTKNNQLLFIEKPRDYISVFVNGVSLYKVTFHIFFSYIPL